ncbi:MAG: DsbA family protein [Myxococcota bacterium]
MKAELRARVLDAYLTPGPLRRGLRQLKRRPPLGRPTLEVYHQVDDPHSTLLVQGLERLFERHEELGLRFSVVPAPAADADPEPALRRSWARVDAAWLAATSDLAFPAEAAAPSDDRVRRANAVLLRPRPAREQLRVAARVGDALWRGDASALAALTRELGTAPGLDVSPELEAHYRSLRKRGHYQGGMVRFGGEWFWGVDRLPFLLRALRDAGVGDAAPLVAWEPPARAPAADPLEVFFSFRSPYSYLAIARLWERWRQAPFPLRLRPVLPMVMRGLPVPRIKRLYIVRDARRLADAQGAPFGRLCDPVGPGVERCLAVLCALPDVEAQLRFAAVAMRGIWSEARDVATDRGLRAVSEDAGIDEALVHEALAKDDWREVAETNRQALRDELGFWGVPSFRLGPHRAWGQDRLDALLANVAGR